MYPYELERVCSYCAELNPEFEVIGPTHEGLRVNVYVTGGQVSGEKINGKFRPVGADWLLVGTDGVARLDVRATIETNDGALIYLSYNAIADLGEDGYQRFLEGKPPTKFAIHGAPNMTCGHPDYQWLSRVQLINIGEADLTKPSASYDIYAIR